MTEERRRQALEIAEMIGEMPSVQREYMRGYAEGVKAEKEREEAERCRFTAD